MRGGDRPSARGSDSRRERTQTGRVGWSVRRSTRHSCDTLTHSLPLQTHRLLQQGLTACPRSKAEQRRLPEAAGHPPWGPLPGHADLAAPRPRAAGTLSCQLSPRRGQGLPGHPWAAVSGSGSEQTSRKRHTAGTGEAGRSTETISPPRTHACTHPRVRVHALHEASGPPEAQRALGPAGRSRWRGHVRSGLRPCQACTGARTLQSVGWHTARRAGAARRAQLSPRPLPPGPRHGPSCPDWDTGVQERPCSPPPLPAPTVLRPHAPSPAWSPLLGWAQQRPGGWRVLGGAGGHTERPGVRVGVCPWMAGRDAPAGGDPRPGVGGRRVLSSGTGLGCLCQDRAGR